jgi:Gpi18-like mannosyltransferase
LTAREEWRGTVSRFGVSEAFVFIYPPFFAVLMKPFTYFPFSTAYGLWSALTVLLAFASVWITLLLGGRRTNTTLALILIVGLFSFSPFFQELLVGQVASLLLFLCTLGVWLLSRDQEWSPAFCFAVATMIKLTPIIAVPLLAMHRKWRWLAAYGCWMVCLIVFSIWRAGWAAHEQFLHRVIPSLSCGVATVGNVSIMAFVQELFLGYVPMDGFQSTLPRFACALSKGVSFTILGLMMFRFYRYRKNENLVLHLGLVILLSQAISPITWMHHYVIALLPLLYFWCRAEALGGDYLLLVTMLAIGTNITVFPLSLLISNHAIQLVLAGVVPCLTLALVYFRVPPRSSGEGNFQRA